MAEPYEALDVAQEVVDQSGRPTPYLESFLYEREVLLGTGSPENNVEAVPGRFYVDQGGSTGNVLYVKQTGTGDTGWKLIG